MDIDNLRKTIRSNSRKKWIKEAFEAVQTIADFTEMNEPDTITADDLFLNGKPGGEALPQVKSESYVERLERLRKTDFLSDYASGKINAETVIENFNNVREKISYELQYKRA